MTCTQPGARVSTVDVRPVRAGATQPALGLLGLLLVVPVAAALALGAGGEGSTLVLAPLVAYSLPLVVTVAFWWEDWPGTRLRASWAGWADTVLIAAGAVVLTAVGQALAGHVDPARLFDPSPGPGQVPTFPATMPLAGTAFVTMLQITLVGEGWPLRRLRPVPAGLLAVAISWAVALVVYVTLVEVVPPAGSGVTARHGPVPGAELGAVLVLVGAWQVLCYVTWRGWPLATIRSRAVRLTTAHVVVLGGGLCGRLPTAAALVDEANAVTDTVAAGTVPGGALWLAAWQGRADALRPSPATAIQEARGIGSARAHTAGAVLSNGLGRYERAIAEAQRAVASVPDLTAANWGLTELVEAAVRLGRRDLAADAVARLSESTRASGTDWALGMEARARALLSDDDSAEFRYREAIERLGRTRVRAELARTRLLYGEWLRRSHRRIDSRDQLRAAEQMFTAMGAGAFAERARRELAAAGEKARRRTVITPGHLTAREAQIARMARDGMSNPEIGRRLFLSPRTVEYHLGNVFAKLGIASRHEVDRALTGTLAQGRPA
jgi:DNA-binding CsgD family transcriptional regulator